MSIAISSQSAVHVAQAYAKRGPQAVPRPTPEPSPVSAASDASKSAPFVGPSDPADRAGDGATVADPAAQDSHGNPVQGSGEEPTHDPGLQDGTTMFGDITGDSELDGQDITALLKAFNTSVSQADLNADGNVDSSDLGLLITAIHDLNSGKGNPGGGPVRDYDPLAALSAAQRPSDLVTDQKTAPLTNREPLIGRPVDGDSDEPVAQPGMFGDLTGDGIVNEDDLAMLKKNYGTSEAMGDLNGDGRVDSSDLGSMIGLMSENDSV